MRSTPIRGTSSRSIEPLPMRLRTARGRFALQIPIPSEAGQRILRRSSRRQRYAQSPWNDSLTHGLVGSRSRQPHFRQTLDRQPEIAYSLSTDRPIL